MEKKISKYFLLISFSFFLFSCNKKSIEKFETFTINDTITVKGYKKDTLRYGIWEYFDQNGNLLEIVEYKIINNESYYNQAISLNNERDTVHEKTTFYNFDYINDSLLRIKFHSLFDKYYETDNIALLLYSDKLKEDFSNLKKIKLDTLYLKNNIVNIKTKSSKFRGIIQELHFNNDSTFLQREVYVDINEKSKNFPNK